LKKGSIGEQKKFPNMEKRCLPKRKISLKKICPLGGVKLRLGMRCIPKNDVPRDWMQHYKERRMGLPE
jgi:hypothetical protein